MSDRYLWSMECISRHNFLFVCRLRLIKYQIGETTKTTHKYTNSCNLEIHTSMAPKWDDIFGWEPISVYGICTSVYASSSNNATAWNFARRLFDSRSKNNGTTALFITAIQSIFSSFIDLSRSLFSFSIRDIRIFAMISSQWKFYQIKDRHHFVTSLSHFIFVCILHKWQSEATPLQKNNVHNQKMVFAYTQEHWS